MVQYMLYSTVQYSIWEGYTIIHEQLSSVFRICDLYTLEVVQLLLQKESGHRWLEECGDTLSGAVSSVMDKMDVVV